MLTDYFLLSCPRIRFHRICRYYSTVGTTSTASILSPTAGCNGNPVWVNYNFNTVQGQTTICSGTSGQYPLTYTSTCNSVFSNAYPGLNPPASTMGGFVKIEQFTVRSSYWLYFISKRPQYSTDFLFVFSFILLHVWTCFFFFTDHLLTILLVIYSSFDVQDNACTAPKVGLVTPGYITSNSELPGLTYTQIGVCSLVAGSFINQMVGVDSIALFSTYDPKHSVSHNNTTQRLVTHVFSPINHSCYSHNSPLLPPTTHSSYFHHIIHHRVPVFH